MKKSLKKLIATVCSLCFVSSAFVACGVNPSGGKTEIDKTKTQLYIGNFDGGMGSRWLDEYKKGFEALYANQSFEKDKMGVEVVVLNDKETYAATNLERSMNSSCAGINVFFSELVNYYKFVEEGLVMDITSTVTSTIPGENKTIKDKLTETQQGYYEIEGKYYGLPHYRSFRGIVYDKDLFNKKKLYIKANGQVAGKEGDTDLSHGPDGQPNTHDDGLPATYDEFFSWCNTVKTSKNITPIIWNGANKESYTKHLLDALFADASGATAGNAYYNVPETPTEFKVVTGFTGNTPNEQMLEISRDNHKMTEQIAGSYYSLEFLQRIISGNYYYSLSMNSTFSHEEAHYDFLHSRFDPEMQEIAMMVEGTWWEEEANGVFEGMSDYEGASRSERNFGFLPLPKPNANYLGEPTLFDANQSILMINANCNEVKADLAKKFIQYISTDANLQLFNTITGIGRDYTYTLTKDQQEGLTSFAKDIYNLTQSGGGIVYGYTTTLSNYTWDKTHVRNRYASIIENTLYSEPIEAFNTSKTAKEYFEGIIEKNR